MDLSLTIDSAKNIQAGEELYLSYGAEFWSAGGSQSLHTPPKEKKKKRRRERLLDDEIPVPDDLQFSRRITWASP